MEQSGDADLPTLSVKEPKTVKMHKKENKIPQDRQKQAEYLSNFTGKKLVKKQFFKSKKSAESVVKKFYAKFQNGQVVAITYSAEKSLDLFKNLKKHAFFAAKLFSRHIKVKRQESQLQKAPANKTIFAVATPGRLLKLLENEAVNFKSRPTLLLLDLTVDVKGYNMFNMLFLKNELVKSLTEFTDEFTRFYVIRKQLNQQFANQQSNYKLLVRTLRLQQPPLVNQSILHLVQNEIFLYITLYNEKDSNTVFCVNCLVLILSIYKIFQYLLQIFSLLKTFKIFNTFKQYFKGQVIDHAFTLNSFFWF